MDTLPPHFCHTTALLSIPQTNIPFHPPPPRSYPPMSVSSLLEQFEALMSPAAKGVLTPEQQQGAAAHAAWEELQSSLKR